MVFPVDTDLLNKARGVLSNRERLYWIVGGAGSGKTTVCRILSERHRLPVYDMDTHIYGSYHSRFTPERHPVNTAWSTSENGLAWLLGMSWDEFNSFNQAALPEYLDLLAEDLNVISLDSVLVIDGGICNPALIAQVIPTRQMVCLSAPININVWESTDRQTMKAAVYQLPNPDKAWLKFLDFDKQITRTIEKECQDNNIVLFRMNSNISAADLAGEVARLMGL